MIGDYEIVEAMGAALGFMPAEVIASRIDREHGQIVVVLRRGSKLQWNIPADVLQPIESSAPDAPIESAPESIVEAHAEPDTTIDVVDVPKPRRRSRRIN